MSDFEMVLLYFLIPINNVLIYIAGKYDLLLLISEMLAKKVEELNDERRNEHEGDSV